MKFGIRFREDFSGKANSDMNNRTLNKAQRNEVRTAMKDGIRRSSGMLRFAHLALVAVFTMVFGVAGLVASAEAAVTQLDAWPNTPQATVTGTTANATWAISNGSNRLMVAVVTISEGTDRAHTASTITYGGVTMHPASVSSGNRRDVLTFYLNEAEIAGRSNNTFTVTVANSANTSAYLGSYTGVDQITPLGGVYSIYNANTAPTLTYGSGLTVVDGGASVFGVATNSTATPTVTESYILTTRYVNGTNNIVGYREFATGTTTNPTLTYGANIRGGIGALTINPLSCVDTNSSSVALTNPTNGATVSGSIAITTTLNNAATVEYSIDGGAWISDLTLWNSANTHPTSTTAPVAGVTVDVRAIEDECGGYVTDSITVTVDNTCSESQPSVIWTAQSTAAGDFSGLPFVTLTNIAAATMEYQVTEGSGAPPAFSTYTENFATGNNFGSWVASDTDATAEWLTLNGQTPSGTNTVGPTVDQSGSGFFAYTEATGATYPYDSYLVSPSIDAATYAPTLDFYWNKNHAGSTYCELYVDASSNDGATWDNMAIWNPVPPTLESADGATWTQATIDLSGITPTGGQDNIKVRFRTVSGGYQCDTGLDTITIDATPRTVETTVIPWTADLIPGMTNLTNGNPYNLYARGLSSTCGVAYYGDSVANAVTPGTPTTFTWSACTETATLTLNPITDPITGNVSVTASGSATGIQVGIVPAPTNASGWIYTPAQDDNTTTVSFYATGTGTCGPLTDSQLNVSTNTMVAPTVTAFSIPATVVDTAAPLEISVTTFTATDNVGVTGYMITESATAPGAGDAGWSGTAPAIYTVPAYNTYTLYAWAKDAAGNVSLSAFTATEVINCTPGTITFASGSVPNPITGTINFSGYITLTDSGDSTVSNAEYSVDSGAWTPIATSYVPVADTLGTINVVFRASDTCSGTVLANGGAPYVLNTDTRTADIKPQNVSATQNGLTGIRVTTDYCNDNNNNAEVTVRYKLDSDLDIPANWTTVGPIVDGQAGDGDGTLNEVIVITIPGLTTGELYDVELTYTDGDGVNQSVVTMPWADTVEILAWSDNPLLHNVMRFACDLSGYADQGSCEGAGGIWTIDSKWATGWGTSTGEYGPITCATCHDKNTGNVKRVTATVVASVGSFPGGTVSLQTVQDGSSEFGDDAGGHTSSDRICEVCHTRTNYHRYDTTTQGGGIGHYNQADCIKCHQHSDGFRANCSSCHANPPIGPGVAGLDTSVATGSATAGKHELHAVTIGYACNTCHTGWENSGQMPNSGNVNLGFNISLGAMTDTTGNYNGRSTGGGYTKAAGTAGTNNDNLTCSAIYCHGTASPQWADAGTAVCGSCHGSATGMPSEVAGDGDLAGNITGTQVGKHSAHVVTAGYSCSLCHNGAGDGTANHVDGENDIIFDTALAGASATYTKASNTCSNLACHISKVWDTATVASCDMCHGYPPLTDGSANDLHVAGATPVDHSGANITSKHGECNLCHGYSQAGGATDNTGNGGDLYQVIYHRDGNIEMNGISAPDNAQSAEYDQTTFGCAKACHANAPAYQLSNSGLTVVTHEYGSGSCTGCHDGTGTGATLVNDNSPHALAATGLKCEECHGSHGGGTIEIPNNPTVGINYTANGETGIALGAVGTAPGATEAEICWNCHDNNGISEWGQNSKQAGSPVSAQYNYGSLYSAVTGGSTTSNWTTAFWRSPKTEFAYKSGKIQSTHAASSSGTSVVTGTNYARFEAPDAVANIRCSYCHDVHDTATGVTGDVSGKPYLRGTWYSNPYEEDGAPQSGMTYANNTSRFGRIPRGINTATSLGGFYIDQNNVVPGTAGANTNGTASINPTSGWDLAGSAGLCTLCHGTNVNTMDIAAGQGNGGNEGLWLGPNGHANAVLGGTGTASGNATNIFTMRGGATGVSTNPLMHFSGVTTDPGRGTNRGYRNTCSSALKFTPPLNPLGTPRAYGSAYNYWGTITVTNNTIVDNQYHQFSCSKCHNPHASRLPKLMITNCLDTKHNTWDDAYQLLGANSSYPNTSISNWGSAQNCHRRGGVATGAVEPVDTGAAAAGDILGNQGWNRVTPWTTRP